MSSNLLGLFCRCTFVGRALFGADSVPVRLARVCAALLGNSARAEHLRKAVFYGWLMGFVAHLVGFHWLVYTISAFGGFPYSISAIVFLLYAALQAIQMALFALLVRSVGFGPLAIFPACFGWRSNFCFRCFFRGTWPTRRCHFCGLSRPPILLDLTAPVSSSSGLTRRYFELWFLENRNPRFVFSRSAVRFLRSPCRSSMDSRESKVVGDDMATARKLSVAAVQGNVNIDLKWDPALAQKNLDEHRKLTDRLDAVDLVIWPESAVEFMVPEDLPALPPELMPSQVQPNLFYLRREKFSRHARPPRRQSL